MPEGSTSSGSTSTRPTRPCRRRPSPARQRQHRARRQLHRRGLGRPRRRLRPVPWRRHRQRRDHRQHHRRQRTSPSPTTSARFTVGQRIEIADAGGLLRRRPGTPSSTTTSTATSSRSAAEHPDPGRQRDQDGHQRRMSSRTRSRTARAYFTKAQLGGEASGHPQRQAVRHFGYTLTPTEHAPGQRRRLGSPPAAAASRTAMPSPGTGATVRRQTARARRRRTPTPRQAPTSITLTVERVRRQRGLDQPRTSGPSRSDAPPAAGGTLRQHHQPEHLGRDGLTDNSTDANGVKQVAVNWGDGGACRAPSTPRRRSLSARLHPHLHHRRPASSSADGVRHRSASRRSHTCPPVTLSVLHHHRQRPAVQRHAGAVATVIIKKGAGHGADGLHQRLGNYSVGNLKPGTYTVTATKAGLPSRRSTTSRSDRAPADTTSSRPNRRPEGGGRLRPPALLFHDPNRTSNSNTNQRKYWRNHEKDRNRLAGPRPRALARHAVRAYDPPAPTSRARASTARVHDLGTAHNGMNYVANPADTPARNRICIFCHAPHNTYELSPPTAAPARVGAGPQAPDAFDYLPLWNHTLHRQLRLQRCTRTAPAPRRPAPRPRRPSPTAWSRAASRCSA